MIISIGWTTGGFHYKTPADNKSLNSPNILVILQTPI